MTRIGFKPLVVGAVHGLAGSAALTLLVLSQIASPWLGLAYLFVFGVGSVGGMLFSTRVGPRLAIGWALAAVVSILGMYLAVILDLPTGATIVCTFGLALIVMAVVKVLLPKRA